MTPDELTEWTTYRNRPPVPNLGPGDEVILPDALGGARGRIKFASAGSATDWAIAVPFNPYGALVYVHKADVRPAPPASEEAGTDGE